MPVLSNYTPFPNFRYYSTDKRGEKFGVIIVKGTYQQAPSGRLLTAEEQAPLVFTDACHGAVNSSSLWHPSDLVPCKPKTDIIVNAVAYSPTGKVMPTFECAIRIDTDDATIVKRLRVTGPRHWKPKWKRALNDTERLNWRRMRSLFEGWVLGEPDPIERLPLLYEYAYGGTLQKGKNADDQPVVAAFEHNPLGRGWIDDEWTDHTQPIPAPQVESLDDPVIVPGKVYSPQGLGPIPPAWLPRRPLGGTYDQNWIDNIWPNWPPDYDFAYHNSAHPDLVAPGFLRGTERIILTGLSPAGRESMLHLPGEDLAVDFETQDGETVRKAMNLDTVFLDIAEPEQRERRVFLSWRVTFEPDRFIAARIVRLTRLETLQDVRERTVGESEA